MEYRGGPWSTLDRVPLERRIQGRAGDWGLGQCKLCFTRHRRSIRNKQLSNRGAIAFVFAFVSVVVIMNNIKEH